MNLSDNKNINEENEIDLLDLGKNIWQKRKFIVKVSAIGIVIGIIIAFSMPREYSTSVVLAPEAKNTSGTGNMGALAAMAGINLQSQSSDIISPELYPDIAGSTPFILGLFDVKVQDQRNGVNTTLYTYLDKYQKKSWWSYILGAPSKMLGVFSSKKEPIVQQDSIDSRKIELTRVQENILINLKQRINVAVDKKTGIITLSVMMQSPQISAYVADTVISYFQDYIIKYRTQKARQDLLFTEKLYEEAKANYYKAQQNYAAFSDENLNIISARFSTTKERLQNEMSLTYGVYNQMAQQLQMARVKVQDTTPVYIIIQPSIVPMIPEKPNKKMIVIGFFIIAFIGACGWIILKDYLSPSFNTNK